MKDFPLVNIYSFGRLIYLFGRTSDGKLIIEKDDSLYPFYYEPSEGGKFTSFDGVPLRKIVTPNPYDIVQQKTQESYEADIRHTTRYITTQLNNFIKCPVKWFVIDIEVISDIFSEPAEAKSPIGYITIYNSFTDSTVTWDLSEYPSEEDMLIDFTDYIKREQPDLLLGWNMLYDYSYLFNRYQRLFEDSMAEIISPIGKFRSGHLNKEKVQLPAGISVVDLLLWYKKIYKDLPNYDLDSVFKHEFGSGKEFEIDDYSQMSDQLKSHNIEDVVRLVELVKKKNIIGFYDELRRFTRADFEAFDMPSKLIDSLILTQAHKDKVVLPSSNFEREDVGEFEGAFREMTKAGLYEGLGQYDLGSAYPMSIINFCIDSANISTEPQENSIKMEITDRETNEVKETFYVIQNPYQLLPKVIKSLMTEKNKLKTELNALNRGSQEYKDLESTYEAVKVVTNTAYGVCGNRGFRLYDRRVAALTTSTVRDLLRYIKNKLKENNYEAIYFDTDSAFVKDNGQNIVPEMNVWIQEWSIAKFGKPCEIKFDYKGRFNEILLLAMTHYIGRLQTDKGIKVEVKGIQAKKSNSTAFIAAFQPALINKILDKEPKDQIVEWIRTEIERIKTVSLMEIARPASLKRPIEEYIKKDEIFVRALRASAHVAKFKKRLNERFYWCPINAILDKEGSAILDTKEKEMTVIAFDKKNHDFVTPEMLDWDEIIKTNIKNIVTHIFTVMNWVDDYNDLFPKKIKQRKLKIKK